MNVNDHKNRSKLLLYPFICLSELSVLHSFSILVTSITHQWSMLGIIRVLYFVSQRDAKISQNPVSVSEFGCVDSPLDCCAQQQTPDSKCTSLASSLGEHPDYEDENIIQEVNLQISISFKWGECSSTLFDVNCDLTSRGKTLTHLKSD